ncbi:hypothetical protein Tco_1482273 [Tanacetum coccineum]
MFLYVDQLEKQLDNEEFQEIGSMAAFKVLETSFKLKERDTSSRSGNDAHAADVDIKPIYDEEPMAEVQITTEINVFATGQQHTEQPEFNNEGEVDQSVEQCHDTCPLPANTTTAFMSETTLEFQARFASQVDVNNDLSKPVTTHYLPNERESTVAKPHHMIAPGTSRIRKDGDGDALFQLKSNSLPHAHAQTTKTYYKHRDSRIMKVQELKTKTSAQTLLYKIFLQRYQVYQGRLLASFQDDAKYEHVGQDTRPQGGKDDQDGRIKI